MPKDNMEYVNVRELLTVVVLTSPIPSNPGTELIDLLFAQLQKFCLLDANGGLEHKPKIIISCDGIADV